MFNSNFLQTSKDFTKENLAKIEINHFGIKSDWIDIWIPTIRSFIEAQKWYVSPDERRVYNKVDL